MGRVVLACKSDEEEIRTARVPPPFPTRFSRTGGASVVVTASVPDLCILVRPAEKLILEAHTRYKGEFLEFET